jgi:hypothetical protein
MILPAVSPGQYQVDFPMEQPGAYMIQVVEKESGNVVHQQTAGLVQSYSPEFLLQVDQLKFIEQLAAAGGGQVLDPAQFDLVGKLVAPEAVGKIPLWPKFLMFAALLLPIDIASRRFNWNAKWVSALGQRLGSLRHASSERVEHGQESLIQSIKERKISREQLYQSQGETKIGEQSLEERNRQEYLSKLNSSLTRPTKAGGLEESGEVVPKVSEKNLEENPEGGFSARLLAAKKRVADKKDKKE